MNIPSLGAVLFHADRQTSMTHLIGGFYNIVKAIKNEQVLKKSAAFRVVSE